MVKARSNGRLSAIVLQGHDASFGVQCAIGIPQPQPVSKFERQGRGKQNLARRAKFNDCALAEGVAGSAQSGEPDWNADWRGVRKELCQLAGGAFAI